MKEMEFNPEIRTTGDGSHTLFVKEIGEAYHSGFGAVGESMHVFIRAGLHAVAEKTRQPAILEVGLGTGLNLLLTCLESLRMGLSVDYTAIEPRPVSQEVAEALNYPLQLSTPEAVPFFSLIHRSPWNIKVQASEHFSFRKFYGKLEDYDGDGNAFNLVYYDAFSPAAQPELWTKEIFSRLAGMMAPAAVLVTYSAKGQVRRDLQSADFSVERLPGPAGKREMIRAVRR